MKRRLYEIVREGVGDDPFSKWFDYFIMSLIGLSVVAVTLESVESIGTNYRTILAGFEVFCVIVFSVEYILRVIACTENENYRGEILGRLKFILTPLALVDLIAILPFYLPFIVGDYRFLRIIRLIRLFNLLKVSEYSRTLVRFTNVVERKKEDLAMAFIIVSFLLVIASSTMYFVEHNAQPDQFSSIPASLWWAVSTLTTVGYGDMVPVTTMGKLLGGVISVIGIGLFALPAGILASGFEQEIERERRARMNECPECGQSLDSGRTTNK